MDNDTGWVEDSGILPFASTVVLCAFALVAGFMSYDRGVQLQEVRKAQCSLCPDQEEEKCEKDRWPLGYILHHCPREPEAYICVDQPKLIATEADLEHCTRRLISERRRTLKYRGHVDTLMEVCRKEKK